MRPARGHLPAVPLAVAVVLAGCWGLPGGASTEQPAGEGPTSTAPPAAPTTATETCTTTGGQILTAARLDDANASNVTATPASALSSRKRDAFSRMVDGYADVEYPLTADEFPAYVRYNDSVYDIEFVGYWDGNC